MNYVSEQTLIVMIMDLAPDMDWDLVRIKALEAKLILMSSDKSTEEVVKSLL